MLRLMRDYAGSWMIKFILGAIVIVFVFWGMESWQSNEVTQVAVVNEQPITIEAYRQAYNMTVEQMRQSFGKTLDDEMLKMLNVKERALNSLIDQALILQQAEKMGFQVTDEDLASAIRNIPAFQSAGVFNNRLYLNLLGNNRMTPEDFEDSQRKSMLAGKMRALIVSGVEASDDEALEWFNWQNAMVAIDYVLFPPGDYSDIQVTDEDIRGLYDKDPSRYKTEPMVKVRYLKFLPINYLPEVSVDVAEIQDYYRSNAQQFRTPKTVEARHILIKVDPNAPPQLVDEKRKQALDILEQIRSGKDFVEAAKEFSEGPSRDQGGYIGTFKREEMVKPFSDRAFAMSPGEVSEPVRTRFGWHLIKVEKVNDASVQSLEEATPAIHEQLLLSRARNRAYDEAEAVFDAAFDDQDLIRAAGDRNLTVETTELFTRAGPEKGIQNRVEFADAAFGLPVMEISDIQDLGGAYYLLQVVEKAPERIPAFDEVETAVREDLIREKQDQKARQAAEAFLTACQSGGSLEEEASRLKLKSVSTGLFKRDGSIPVLGYEPAVATAAFQLADDMQIAPEVVNGEQGYFVIRLKERQYPEPGVFDGQKEAIRGGLVQQKQQKVFSEWLAGVKESGSITIKEGFLD